ncbi:FtsK/SpoIIIE domain-containing protein, partial [Limosilactobacillus equigenerosi]
YMDLAFEPHLQPAADSLVNAIKRLANLNHIEVEQNSIPESVTFLDLYHVKRAEELAIMQRWQQADTSKTLAAPLGLRGKDDVVELNLHERAHGPHGLIAGTTGSGKSELLQSYMLSLAVNFAPEDVGFLPIDYKGGGMANLFANLPHLMGMITNLDG